MTGCARPFTGSLTMGSTSGLGWGSRSVRRERADGSGVSSHCSLAARIVWSSTYVEWCESLGEEHLVIVPVHLWGTAGHARDGLLQAWSGLTELGLPTYGGPKTAVILTLIREPGK